MLLIMKDSVVSVDYELKVDDGNGNLITADKSQPGQPLIYLHGSGMLLAEFEKNLLGKTTGDTVHFTVSAENGYGTRRDEDIVEIPVDSFKGQDGNLDTTVVKVGNVLPMMDNQGNQFQGIVVDVNDQFVVMDFNHPMAGKVLNFTVTVLDVRPATAEELAHGHVHGEGGHHH